MITRKDIEKDLHDCKAGKMGDNAFMDAVDVYSERQSKEALDKFARQLYRDLGNIRPETVNMYHWYVDYCTKHGIEIK